MDFASNMFSMFGLFAAGILLWVLALVWVWGDADEKFANTWLWVLGMILFPYVTFPAYLIIRAIIYRGGSVESQTALSDSRNPSGWGRTLRDNPDRDLSDVSGRYEGNGNYTLNTSRPGPGYKPFSAGYRLDISDQQPEQPSAAAPGRRHDWLT